MNNLEELWQSVLNYLLNDLGVNDTAIGLWIKPAKFADFEGGIAHLWFESQFIKSTVRGQFEDKISKAFEAVCGFPVEVIYESPEDLQTEVEIENINIENLKNNNLTFDNFIEGPSNKLAITAAKSIAANPGGQINHVGANYNPLFIYGNSGLGKTHILNAIQNEINKVYPDFKIVYSTCEQFLNEFMEALQNKNTDEFRAKYRNIDVLLIDDIQFIAGKDATEEEFFHTFNALVENGKQVVLTSDRPPKDIRSLTDRLRSRFVAGLIVDIQPPEFDTRCAIIKRKAKLLDFKIPENIVEFIAERIKANIRQLEGATKKLKATCEFTNQQPSIALAQKAISDILNDTQPLPVTIEHILGEVSRTTGVTVDEIRGKKRTANIANARKMVFYILRQSTDMSYEDIGKEFGRDHSTIIYNIREMEEIIKTNTTVGSQISDIVNNIKDIR